MKQDVLGLNQRHSKDAVTESNFGAEVAKIKGSHSLSGGTLYNRTRVIIRTEILFKTEANTQRTKVLHHLEAKERPSKDSKNIKRNQQPHKNCKD